MRTAEEIFDRESLVFLQEEIAANGGRETFFRAEYSAGSIRKLEVVARGSEDAVPAQMDLPAPFNTVIHNHPSADLTPSEADLALAARFCNSGVAFLIVDSNAESVNVVVEPVVIREEVKIDPDETAAFFAPGGGLEKKFPGFEHRETQASMAGRVQEVFNEGMHGVVEAPTGTGKSLAYLLPLVRWAVANGRRALVCTHTIPLQQQLLEKDIPVVRELIDDDFKAVLLKGRSNYLCIRKLGESRQFEEELFSGNEQDSVAALEAWAEKTADGSFQEIDFEISRETWGRVAADGDTCLGVRCPSGGRCFFRRSRREAVEADLVVANHALFLADLVVRGEKGKDAPVSVMPWCERVVIDEAHNLEDGATGHFGRSFSGFGLVRRIGRFYSRRRKKERGTIVVLRSMLGGIPGATAALNMLQDEVIPALEALREKIPDLFLALNDGFCGLAESGRDRTVRLTPPMRHFPLFTEQVAPALRDLIDSVSNAGRTLSRLWDEWIDLDKKARDTTESIFLGIAAGARRLEEDKMFLQGVLSDFDENTVYWAATARSAEAERLSLNSAPVCVAPILQEKLFKRYRGVLYTSATIAVDGSFDFFLKRTGLEAVADSLSLMQLPPAFDYNSRSLFGVPEPFPAADSPGFPDAFGDFAAALIQSLGGRIFFLFTSWKQLDECYEAAMAGLPEGWRNLCMKQDPGRSREQLLRGFRETRGSVLFGVNSFWEGVDVKGAGLIGVVIAKLPFQVPSDPVVRARVEMIDNGGGSSFMEYSLPNAVIRFKQGVGRLLRTKEDYGFLCILDNRVFTKRYGSLFLHTVPGSGAIRDNGPGLVVRAADFIRGFE